MNAAEQTRQLIEMLRHRHPEPEWATFVELPVQTGGGGGRLDVYAFNVWPSSKYRRVAYEVKATRSDFAREMSDPLKREPAETVANECFFATESPGRWRWAMSGGAWIVLEAVELN